MVLEKKEMLTKQSIQKPVCYIMFCHKSRFKHSMLLGVGLVLVR